MWSSRRGRSDRSWSALGAVFGAPLGRLGRVLARLGALEGSMGTLLEAPWAVWERVWVVLGPSRSGGHPQRRTCGKNIRLTKETSDVLRLEGLLEGILDACGG
eukprot:6077998-Pyramimonas_sp.AAC.1